MKNRHPLAINLLKLQEYDFNKITIEEVIFFEWLVIKRISFGSDTFYYSQKNIICEIGIKRTKLETTKRKLLALGLEEFHSEIYNTLNYIVSLQFIKNFIDKAVKDDFKKDRWYNITKLQWTKNKPVKKKELYKLDMLIDLLNRTYNRRRERYNEQNRDQELQYTEIPVNEKSYRQLLELTKRYEDDRVIENSFIAYCDAILNSKEKVVSNMTNHFSSYDSLDKSFKVFEFYLNIYNQNYSVKY